MIDQVLSTVNSRYVEQVDQAELELAAAQAVVAKLDPYSKIVSAVERDMLASPRAESLGVMLSRSKSGSVVVSEILPGSPADRAGLKVGDEVMEMDGVDVANFASLPELSRFFARHTVQPLRLKVQNKDGLRSLGLLGDVTGSGSNVEVHLVPTKAAVLLVAKIAGFRRGTAKVVLDELARIRATIPQGTQTAIVFDLRGNPGGEIEEAILLADALLEDGLIVRLRGRSGVILRDEMATPGGQHLDDTAFVLQDRWSASASELFAAALQGHGRATVVGEKSYGKGSVQSLVELPSGSLLRLTTARYYSVTDRRVDGVGITPDVALVLPRSTEMSWSATRDPGLRKVAQLVDAG